LAVRATALDTLYDAIKRRLWADSGGIKEGEIPRNPQMNDNCSRRLRIPRMLWLAATQAVLFGRARVILNIFIIEIIAQTVVIEVLRDIPGLCQFIAFHLCVSYQADR
jgi:hypothetical protein